MFEQIKPAPPDPILGLTEAFKKDPHPRKINLGVGVYVDDEGKTPLFESVKKAEKRILESEHTKSYLPIAGSSEYGQCVQELIFSPDHPVVKAGRLRTAHTPGGTGGLRVGAEFLKKIDPSSTVWLSSPTWPNHRGIFTSAGFPVKEYPYYDAKSHGLDFGRMCRALEKVPARDIVLLQVCCHNPSGVDLTADQAKTVAAIAVKNQWIPFFDFAYQGLGTGLVEDRAALLSMLDVGVDCLVASSFSKNFGLYNERVGALTIVAANSADAESAFSHLKVTVRVVYSNPPAHGGRIVTTVLQDAGLKKLWEGEVAAMRRRILSVRSALVDGLHRRNAPMDFSFIKHQHGMFSFSGLSDAQVDFLREKKGIYMVSGGRINVAGITAKNIDYLCDSVMEALSLRPAPA